MTARSPTWTRKSGLGVSLFGLGVAVGDMTTTASTTFFITAVGQNHLLHNNGNGTLPTSPSPRDSGDRTEFSTGAAWVDYDRDGKLDLVVANYVQWVRENRPSILRRSMARTNPTARAESYKGTSARLWHNLGNGKFEDATQKADATSQPQRVSCRHPRLQQ